MCHLTGSVFVQIMASCLVGAKPSHHLVGSFGTNLNETTLWFLKDVDFKTPSTKRRPVQTLVNQIVTQTVLKDVT